MPLVLTDQIRRRLADDTLVWLTTVSPTGRADLAPDAPPPETLPGLLDKYANLLRTIQMSPDQFTGTYTVAIRITLDHAWTIPD